MTQPEEWDREKIELNVIRTIGFFVGGGAWFFIGTPLIELLLGPIGIWNWIAAVWCGLMGMGFMVAANKGVEKIR